MGKTSLNASEDMCEAMRLATCAAEEGHREAQFLLGRCFSGGKYGVKQDKAKAFHWISKAAHQGDVVAQCELGIMYDKGEGVKQDKSHAFEWFMVAARKGHTKSQYCLGTCFETGSGVKRDISMAIDCYTKAAEQGHEKARLQLNLNLALKSHRFLLQGFGLSGKC
jgi:uncharacterized protein